MMLSHSLALLATCMPFVAAGATGTPMRGVYRRDGVTPGMPFDQNTTKLCSFWLDNDGFAACSDVPSMFGISMEDFLRWVGKPFSRGLAIHR